MKTASVMRGVQAMDRIIVSISSKRQITIPQKFFNLLGFGSEAECAIRGNGLVLCPAKTVSGGEYEEQILDDLVA